MRSVLSFARFCRAAASWKQLASAVRMKCERVQARSRTSKSAVSALMAASRASNCRAGSLQRLLSMMSVSMRRVKALFEMLCEIRLPPDDERQIAVEVGEDDVLHLRGITAFQDKTELLAAHGLLALIRAAQRLNPRTCTRRLCLGQCENEQSAAGMLGGDVLEQVVVSGEHGCCLRCKWPD
jgi:hypothetical protein